MHSQQIDHARARRSRGHAVPALALAAALAGLTACGEDAPSAPVASAKRAETPSATAVTTRAPKKFFVNPVGGKDTNAGSLTAPFKTLAKALSVAIANDTVKLAAGTYSKATNGERFTASGQYIQVPNGVRIEGTLNSSGGNATILQGQLDTPGYDSEIALSLAANAVVTNVSIERFGMGVRALSGKQTLTHLSIGYTHFGVSTQFGAQTVLQNSTVFVSSVADAGLSAVGHAQLTMDGGQLFGPGSCTADPDEGTGVYVKDTAQVTLKNKATLKDVAGVALDLRNLGAATLDNAVISKTNQVGCTPRPRVQMLDSTSLRLRLNTTLSSSGGTSAVGIQAQTKGTLRIDTATVKGFTGAGVRAASGSKLALVMNRGSILQNGVGINAAGVSSGNASITIAGSTIASNQTGIIAPYFKLRKSDVASNRQGVVLTSPFADLGQVGDPGNNLIINNLVTGVTFQSTVVCCGVWATGNTWNAFTQGADGNGHYPPGLIINGTSSLAKGTNFSLPNLNLSIQL